MPSSRNVAPKSLAGPDGFDRFLGCASLLLLAAASIAVARGSADWAQIPWQIWAHLATIGVALALTPVVLWQRRGTRRHRLLGYVWVAALAVTAVLSFDIRLINRGQFSAIHLLSALTLAGLLRLVTAARSHDARSHRRTVRLLATGGLLTAGFFTFPGGRLLGQWLFS